MFAIVLSLPLVLLPVVSEPVQPTCGIDPIVATSVEAPILTSLAERLDAYMEVHNDVERSLAMQRIYDDPEEMFDALEAFQSGIRTARADMRQGTIFTTEVAALIRTRIQQRLAACNEKVENVLAFINDERLAGAPKPKLYEPFPWSLGSAMWASLLPVLPALPEEMQYRFANRDLVLIDVHADLVVDILRNALPAPVETEHGQQHR